MRRAEATIRIDLAGKAVDPETIVAAIAPDNTAEMTTRVENGVIETQVVRESAGGLRSTADDYLLNLRVARRVARSANGGDDVGDTAGTAGQTGSNADVPASLEDINDTESVESAESASSPEDSKRQE